MDNDTADKLIVVLKSIEEELVDISATLRSFTKRYKQYHGGDDYD